MKHVYKSDSNYTIVGLLGLVFLVFLGLIIYNGLYVLIIGLVLFALLIAYYIRTMEYIIDDTDRTLSINSDSGKSIIKLDDILRIHKSSSAITASAASLDRIVIVGKGKEKYIISPKNRSEFIDKIRSLNPDVIINV